MSIVLFGSSRNFKPADGQVTHDSSDLINQPRHLEVMAWNSAHLSTANLSELTGLTNWHDSFPVQFPSQGRTMYAVTEEGAEWSVRGIKLKGAGGLEFIPSSGGWRCYAPRPNQGYGVVDEFHVALGPDLSIHTRVGQPKALNSLRATSARNEYELQERLADAGLGFHGLLHGRFRRSDGTFEKDVHQNETGAVCIEFNPDFSLAGQFVKFCVIPGKHGGEDVVYNEVKHLTTDNPTASALRDNFVDMFRKMADTKRRAFLDAGVGRHAAHYDNFYFEPSTEKMLLTDVDSAVAVSDLSPDERGLQFLRDVAQDTRRMISTLSYSSYTKEFLSALKDHSIKPFTSFLGGYFGDRVSHETLERETLILQEAYLAYVNEKSGRLDWIADQLGKWFRYGNIRVSERLIFSNWDTAHLKFLSHCLLSIYGIMKSSTLSEVGIQLPTVEGGNLRSQFIAGMEQHCRRVQVASEQATGQSCSHLF